MPTLPEILANLGGAALIAGALVTHPLTRSHYRTWGARATELQRAYSGDDRVPDPIATSTLAVSVGARPDQVWPWVAQLGQDRAVLYSYELLENLVGCRMRNADHVDPRWALSVGDLVRMGPEGFPVQRVVAIEPGRRLLLTGADPKTGAENALPRSGEEPFVNFSWLIQLDEAGNGGTRLISRSRLSYAPRTIGNRIIWDVLTDPIGCVMTRRMLVTIARLAEASAAV